jgi:hypothetical protein
MPLMVLMMTMLSGKSVCSNSNSNDEHDCYSEDFKELYKQKHHTALPVCWASISESELQMCMKNSPHLDLPSKFLGVFQGRENVLNKARCN